VSNLRITISKENYLKAIAEAESEGEIVKAVTLTRWLKVSAPAVTMAIRRLRRDSLIRVATEGQITLTPAGREIANRLLNRHHLIERMLTEIFEMPWYAVHEEAERLEHAVSPAFEAKLVAKLGHREVCPHGNGLTNRSDSQRRKHGLQLLSEVPAGNRYRVSSVYERDRKLLEFFDGEGIRPGTSLVVEAQNYDGTVTLTIGKKQARLGLPAARKIWVSRQ
jgi:DtxR family transcriptional regulator, Mn-dependent transcriptional regulator